MSDWVLKVTPAEIRALAEMVMFVDMNSDDLQITDITGLSPDCFEGLRQKVDDLKDQVRGIGL